MQKYRYRQLGSRLPNNKLYDTRKVKPVLDRTIGRNMSGLNNRLDGVNAKLDALSHRMDGKIDKLADRVETRIDNLIRTQVRVHERLGRLEARSDGDGSVPPINFEP